MRVAAIVALVVLVSGCASGLQPTAPAGSVPVASGSATSAGTGRSATLPSADELCALLAPSDWMSAGLQGADPVQADSDGPGTAYCDYTTASGAQGGLELDAFVGASASDAQNTFDTIRGEMPAAAPGTLPGADAVLINKDVAGTYAAIVVRSGRLDYTISLPTSSNDETQLMALAAIVLQRGQVYR